MMSLTPSLLLVISAVLWGMSARKGSAPVIWGAVLAHGVTAFLLVFGPAHLTPMSWVGTAILASFVSGLLVALVARKYHSQSMYISQAVLTLIASFWALSTGSQDSFPIQSWASAPHVVFGVLWIAAMLLATMIAFYRLRGRRVGFLLLAMGITAVPLLVPRASWVTVHHDGEAVMVEARIDDSAGAQGLHRQIPARVSLPYEPLFRQSALFALILGFVVALVRRVARSQAQGAGALGLVVVLIVGVHTSYLASSVFPRPINVSQDEISNIASQTLRREAQGTEFPTVLTVPEPPYQGGPESPSPITWSVFALIMACLAYVRRDPENASVQPGQLERLEVRFASAAMFVLILLVGTGAMWSDDVWGAPLIADPKIFAAFFLMGLYVLYWLTQRYIPNRSDAPSWILVVAFVVLLFSMTGPDLGLIVPTLHHFPG
jgi:hypothetical protein